MTAPIKCGVIGYGGAFNMGRRHLVDMQNAGMVPVAVCEIDPKRRDVAKVDYPSAQTFASVDAMLAESEAQLIAVVTPHNTHSSLALQCIRARRHVMVEKPFAITTDECDQMIEAARSAGVMVSAYHNRHWDGWILRALDEVLSKNAIGDVYKVKCESGGRGMPGDWWRSDRSVSGGVLYDWGVHLLEYCLQIMAGRTLVEVTGFAKEGFWASHADPSQKWTQHPNEDEGRLVARFNDGSWIELMVSSLDKPTPYFLQIVGTKGVYSIGWDGYELWRCDSGTTTIETGKHFEDQKHKLYQNVSAHLTTGEPLIITPEWARRPIHILDLAARSARAGRSLPAQYG